MKDAPLRPCRRSPFWILRLLLSLTRGCKQPLPRALQSHDPGVGTGGSVLGSARFHGDDLTNFHGIPGPASPHEPIWTAQFQSPSRDLASLVGDVDVKPRVWIGPLELGDRTHQRDGLIGVEFCCKR